MKKILPLGVAFLLMTGFFWQFFLRGKLPMPASFQMAWYEPWKSVFSATGVPTIPHKAVGDDVFRQIFPFRDLAIDIAKQHQPPLWNPYGGAGQPLLATLHTGIANPVSVLQMLDSTSGWAWFVMLQFVLLFVSTYWYVRSLGVGNAGAYISAIAMSGSGVAIVRYIYGDYLYALAALPLLLGVIEHGRKNIRYLLLVPWIVAFLVVSVQPQISGYVLLTASCYVILLAAYSLQSFMGAVGIGIGLSLFQLVPTLELYKAANVTTSSSAFIFEKFLMPVQHLITIAIPNFFGNVGTYNFWGKTDYVETAISIGMVPLAAAMIAVYVTRKSSRLYAPIRFFVWGVVISSVATLDFIGTRVVYQLPIPILSTGIPTRIYILTTFFLAVLAGIGFEYLRTAKGKPLRAIALIYGALLLVIIGIVAVTHGMGIWGILSCPSGVPNCVNVATRNALIEMGVYLVTGFFIAATYSIRRQCVTNGVFSIICVILGFVGIYNASKFLPMSPREYVGRSHPLLEALRAVAPNRVAGLGSASLATDLSTQYRYFDTNYYDPLYIRKYGELVSYVNTGDPEKGITRSDVVVVSDATVSAALSFRRERFWDITGTQAIAIRKTEIPQYAGATVWEDAIWRLVIRPSAMPRAYLVSSLTVEQDQHNTLARMFSPETDLTKTAFVDTSILLVPDPQKSEGGRVTIDRYDTQRVSLTADAAQDSYLVLSDTYYPGWKATIDGKDVPMYRTNYAFRGVVMPHGKHTIVFSYAPQSFGIGLIGSVVSLLIWSFWLWKQSSKQV